MKRKFKIQCTLIQLSVFNLEAYNDHSLQFQEETTKSRSDLDGLLYRNDKVLKLENYSLRLLGYATLDIEKR